eukprot:ANDGO_04562.mRNA.1 Vacuolar protein sorting-associated protein 52 A
MAEMDDLDLGDLDFTSTSLSTLETDLASFDQNELVSRALSEGRDLRKYASEIEDEMHELEIASVDDYVAVSDHIDKLHTHISLCDSVLQRMENVLGKFQSDLGSISDEIQVLQDRALMMSIQMKNRQHIGSQLSQLTEQLVIRPELVRAIVEEEVDDRYLDALIELDRKHVFFCTDLVEHSKSVSDLQPELDKLIAKACAKVRDFLVARIVALKKPRTNIQMHQLSTLLKYKFFVEFVHRHRREDCYADIVATYAEVMSKVYSHNFKTYWTALIKLKAKNAAVALSMSDLEGKLKMIDDEETPPIVPPTGQSLFGSGTSSSSALPFEVLYKSAHALLVDTVTSEYLFQWEFLAKDVQTDAVFLPSFEIFDTFLTAHLQTTVSNDILSVCMLIRIVHMVQRVMQKRRVPALDPYCDRTLVLLWPRFKILCGGFVDKLKSTSDASMNTPRSYANLVYAISSTVLHFPNEDTEPAWADTVRMTLAELRLAITTALEKIGSSMNPFQRNVFNINAWALCVDARTGEPSIDDFHARCLARYMDEYVGRELKVQVPFLVRLFTNSANAASDRGSDGAPSSPKLDNGSISSEDIEAAVREFGNVWKEKLAKIHEDVLRSFTDFKNGVEVLKLCFTQLLLYYGRCISHISDRPELKHLKKEIVSQQVMLYEARKYAQDFE